MRLADVLVDHWWYASRDGEAGCHCSYRDGIDMTREQWAEHVNKVYAAALDVDKIARAIFDANPYQTWSWDELPGNAVDAYRDMAAAAVEAVTK